MNRPLRHLMLALGIALSAASSRAMPPMDAPCEQPPGPAMREGMAPDQLPPWLHGINLSEALRDRIFGILHAQEPAMRARQKELRQSREALTALSMSGEFDDVKAKSLADAEARAMIELSLMRARTDHQIYRLLTPEQRKQIDLTGPGEREPRGGQPRR